MIVGRVGREHGTGRERTSRLRHLLPFAGTANAIAFGIGTDSTYQTDKAGKKQPDDDGRPQERVPFDQESLPKTEHYNQISPEKELGIVPFPRSKLYDGTSKEDGCCGKEQQSKP